MVGLVLVSHSRKLAEAVRELVLQMTSPGFPVVVAGGVGNNHDELGTDAVHIADVLQKLACPEGVLVLMDLGSAVLSAQTAVELLDPAPANLILLCPAPLVEGAIAAAVQSQAGASLDEVAREAELGLAAKREQLKNENAAEPSSVKVPLTSSPGQSAELVVEIENQHGLHARPAAALVQAVSRFSSTVEVSNLTSGRGPISARSLTSLALLQIRMGDRIKVVCRGGDCQAALHAIRELASAGFGEKADLLPAPAPEMCRTSASGARGFPVSDGIAIGPLVLLQVADLPDDDEAAGESAAEQAKLTAAMQRVSDQLRHESANGSKDGAGSGAILQAQALLLGDPVVLTRLRSLLESGRLSAARAWIEVTRDLATQYEAMDDPYLRERAVDVRDIARRVLRQLNGRESQPSIPLTHPAILLTDELLPSEAAAFDPATVLGVIAAKGSATSHSAIILRTLGIPMLVGVTGIGVAEIGKTVAIDGSTGQFWIDPEPHTLARLEKSKLLQLQQRRHAEVARKQPSVTLDGTRIILLANVGNARDAAVAAEQGAEGIGLLRTEFLFASRSQAPSEDEQVRALEEIYTPITGPVIVRTFDVGADKPLPFLPQAEEHNPYLGVRGIRLSLRSPDLFLTHLRAILRSGVGHEIWLMFPMISLIEEARKALGLLEQAHQQLLTQAMPHAWPIKRGAMIEVPSAAILSEELARELDFFSIGTNDLTQYTMAAERGDAAMVELQDALHPAVLRLMKSVVDGANTRARHVSVCGDAASDPLAAAIFAGLGIRSLSVRPNRVAEIKALFREQQFAELTDLAQQALQCQEATAVRSLIKKYLDDVSAAHHGAALAHGS
jgi:phosphocarrier protein FPr